MERGAIFCLVGSERRTVVLCLPRQVRFAEQILAYRAEDPDRRIGGLILEVKGDFCARVREILRHGRADDYVEIGLASEYQLQPLHNNLTHTLLRTTSRRKLIGARA